MEFSFATHSLSSFVPVKFNYDYNTKEELAHSLQSYSNNLSYYKYSMFDGAQDVSLSKQNVLVLSNAKSLSSVFVNTINTIEFGNIAGTVLLETFSNSFLTYTGDTVYISPTAYDLLTISIVPLTSNKVELHTNNNTNLIVDATYPYTVRTSNKLLSPDQKYRQEFELEYSEGLLTIKTTTIEGDRYLSYSADNVLRAVGLMLNNKIFNSYLFIPNFITSSELTMGFNPSTTEVKYYNDIESFQNRTTLDILSSQSANTNLLISCATKNIPNTDETNVNIAILKTNFTSTGAYAPAQ
jgi:hypothetical protein